jgi:hypothetical protein
MLNRVHARLAVPLPLTVWEIASGMMQAGDTPWHWASNMKNEEMCDFLVKNGASKKMGNVIVPEHIPKVKVSDTTANLCGPFLHRQRAWESWVEARGRVAVAAVVAGLGEITSF